MLGPKGSLHSGASKMRLAAAPNLFISEQMADLDECG